MPIQKQPAQLYEFDSFRLSAGEGLLLRDGKSLPLTPKAFEILLALVENRGQIVSRDAMMRRVWNDCYVEENCLTKNISTLRKVLGEDKNGSARFIETVPRRGYRFVASVVERQTEKILGSLAVLPFKIFSGRAGAEYLGLGLADVLITRLSNLRQIVVRPTSAVRKYEKTESDAAKIGRELQVDWVLDGSLFQTGERVRATVQFISVSEARPLWGERLDEESADLIAVQDSIAERVTRTLIEKLAIDTKPQSRSATADNAAFREYLEGRFYWNKRTAEGMKKAAECFARAIRIDSQFALAHAGLGDAYLLFSQHALLTPKECFPRARAAARAAIELDPLLAEPHTTLGHVAFLFEWNWRQAELHYRRAVKLNPNYATAHHWYGLFLRSMGRFDEAIAELQTALELDPLSSVMLKNLGAIYANCQQFQAAETVTKKAIELEPDFALARRTLGWIFLQQKMYPQAIEELGKAASLATGDPAILSALGCTYAAAKRKNDALCVLQALDEIARRAHVSKYDVAQIYVKLGDFDKAFELLEKACAERDFSLALLAVDPDFDELRRDSRFQRLLKSIGLDF